MTQAPAGRTTSEGMEKLIAYADAQRGFLNGLWDLDLSCS